MSRSLTFRLETKMPFGTTGAQREASADVRENRFSFKQIDVNYTFELIVKIDLSPSPNSDQSPITS